MRKTTTFQLSAIAALILVAVALAAPRRGNRPPFQQTKQSDQTKQTEQSKSGVEGRPIDLVIALDTSSSMDGLIDGARQKLWDIVNVLGQARPRPALRVGLISYGNTGYDASVGWVRKDADLTTDLDGIYAKLFALRTNGGEEYVARALQEATTDMQWSPATGALKIVFVAGNEPANQDPLIPVETAVARARDQGIFVNTIYCGDASAGEARLWAAVASLGKGRYAAIDQNSAVAVATPLDDELGRLSAELNTTYVGYGAGGATGLANQAAQDKNAASLGRAVAATRASAKSRSVYNNSSWDLVDAFKSKGASAAAMPAASLPAPMKAMSEGERTAFLDSKAKERDGIQEKIAVLSASRDKLVKEARARKSGPKALDDALDGAIVEEAKSAGFAF